MMHVGIAEIKAKLSEYIARVQEGEEIVLTNRGQPVARLIPPGSDDHDTERARLLAMQRKGLIRLGTGKIPAEFWTLERPEDPEAKVRAALISERNEGY